MRWLWFVGPLSVVIIALLLAMRRTPEESRLRKAVRKWLDELIGPLRIGNKTRSRRVRRLHPAFERMVDLAGDGVRVCDAVLVPKIAYLAVRAPSLAAGSQHVTVVAQLEESATPFVARPLPIYDGVPAENTGVRFGKDPEFMETFMVEGQNPKAIGKWLKPALREALMELPEVWLRVHGTYMTLTLYGHIDADTIDELVGVADALYAERGADPDESLLGSIPAKASKKAEGKAGYRSKRRKAGKGKGKGDKKRAKAPLLADAKLRLSCAAVDVGLYLAGLLALVFVFGGFSGMHPAALFNSPDPVVSEPWQGGWTTKGVGALVAVEAFLLGLLTWQSYLATVYGQSLGKALFGARIERTDKKPLSFFRAVVLRHWVWALLPVLAAATRATPLTPRSLFEQIPTATALGTAALLVVVAIGSALAAGGRGLHDRVAGTQVVVTEPYRLPWIQLAERPETDPLLVTRLQILGALFAITALLSVAVLSGMTFWIF